MKKIVNKRWISRVMVFGLLAITMQSCLVAKDYERPELKDETENLYRTDNLPTDSLSMADVSWKEVFTDPYLTQYIEEGLQNNIDIRIAIQQIMAGEAYMKQGNAGYLPSLNGQASAAYQELSKNGQFGGGSMENYDAVLALSWEADIWGKIRSNKRAFHAGYLKSIAAHKAVKTRLVENIATTYYSLVALDAQLKILNETVETREKTVSTIQALKDAGQVTQVAVDQNVAQYNNAKALEIEVQAEIFKLENTLSILLAKQPQHFERRDRKSTRLNSSHVRISYAVFC